MIFWIASYPKSGNTWLRALLSSYFYSEDGNYNEKNLKKIDQFPQKKYFTDFNYDKNLVTGTSKFWIKAQEKINSDKKIKFFKTHNIFGAINNDNFTDSRNSIGALYIVRDPRNVFSSIKNHYELDNDQALNWMQSEKNYIYDVHKFKEDGYSDFQFISSWNTNYKSWKIQKKIPIKIVKYEDLLNETYYTFRDVIEFVNKTINSNHKIIKNKLKNSINSTTFDKLKNSEKKNGFSESVISKKGDKKVPFFFLGPNNDWNKILDDETKNKLNDIYKQNLIELSYY